MGTRTNYKRSAVCVPSLPFFFPWRLRRRTKELCISRMPTTLILPFSLILFFCNCRVYPVNHAHRYVLQLPSLSAFFCYVFPDVQSMHATHTSVVTTESCAVYVCVRWWYLYVPFFLIIALPDQLMAPVRLSIVVIITFAWCVVFVCVVWCRRCRGWLVVGCVE